MPFAKFFDFLQVFYIKKATLYRWLVKTRGLYVTARPLPYPVLGHKSPTSALKRVCPISATAVAIGWQNLCPSFGLPILYHVLANKKSPQAKAQGYVIKRVRFSGLIRFSPIFRTLPGHVRLSFALDGVVCNITADTAVRYISTPTVAISP